MRSNLEDISAKLVAETSATTSTEVEVVGRRARFRGIQYAVKTSSTGGIQWKIQLLDGSGGSPIVEFDVTQPPSAYGALKPMNYVAVPDGSYVLFENGIHMKSPDSADGLNDVAYTVYFT